ncbi:hypothetical protein SNE40_020444 [Patella caerulea]|uniref:G-protein coupled receptors family 1 profile domain-containing protein n=1 Tax=Patella caerulea TaxID=87958 RepID=A0AAN8GAK4_PATCE
MVLHYFGPLAILIFSYSKIGFNIWIKNFRGDEGNNRRLQLAAAKQKMIRMMITVVVSYALCWLPIHTVTLIGDQHPAIYNLPMMPVLWMLFHWLAMSNSCYNPIIYIWMSPKFRTGLKLSIQRCTRRRSLQQRPSDDNLNVKPEDVAKKKTVYCCLLEDKRRRFHDGYTPYRLGHCAYPPPPRLMPLDRLRLSASIHSDT